MGEALFGWLPELIAGCLEYLLEGLTFNFKKRPIAASFTVLFLVTVVSAFVIWLG